MLIPRRVKRQSGRYALVDRVPFELPVASEGSPALMAAFTIDAERARGLMPGNEVHPLRLWKGRGLLLITVIDYRITDIGKYIEFSIAIACTHGAKAVPPLLPGLLVKPFGSGQFVLDLPVSSEISVKGGKGIWGMPKHQANLDFTIGERTVSSRYDLDGELVMKIEIERPGAWLPLRLSAANYCAFRGMLMKSTIYFRGKIGFHLFKKGSATLTLGDHPRARPLKELDISREPVFTAFFPASHGVLDDHFESWFLSYDRPPAEAPEGLESVVGLGLSEEWLEPPADRTAHPPGGRTAATT